MRSACTLPLAAVVLHLALLFAAPHRAGAQQKTFSETEAAQHVGEEVSITGKVVAVSKSAKGTTYLNFGAKFPRNVFTGTVLARDEAKVGDVKMYEGQVVTITGKVQLAQDQKPEILISAATQIKLADGAGTPPAPPATTAAAAPPQAPTAAPKPPMPATTVPAVPVPPSPPTTTASVAPVPTAPPAPEAKKLVLAPNWNSPPQGGEMTRKDLAALFGSAGSASENLEGDSSVMLYPDVPFLAPLAVAKKRLQVEGVSDSVSKVNCPGFPIGSFSAHGFTGIFAGGFNKLNIITDLANQVVSIQVVDDNPRQRSSDVTDTNGYHTYNFINGRSKGSPDLVVKHQIVKEGATKGMVVVETLLLDPTEGEPGAKGSSKPKSSGSSSSSSRTPRTAKVMERSRWYVPGTMVNLILRCVGSR